MEASSCLLCQWYSSLNSTPLLHRSSPATWVGCAASLSIPATSGSPQLLQIVRLRFGTWPRARYALRSRGMSQSFVGLLSMVREGTPKSERVQRKALVSSFVAVDLPLLTARSTPLPVLMRRGQACEVLGSRTKQGPTSFTVSADTVTLSTTGGALLPRAPLRRVQHRSPPYP